MNIGIQASLPSASMSSRAGNGFPLAILFSVLLLSHLLRSWREPRVAGVLLRLSELRKPCEHLAARSPRLGLLALRQLRSALPAARPPAEELVQAPHHRNARDQQHAPAHRRREEGSI